MINREILKEKHRVRYCIAGHLMELTVPDTGYADRLFPSFKPFRCESNEGQKAMCSIRIVEEPIEIEQNPPNVLYEEFDLLGHWFCLSETSTKYIIDLQIIENEVTYRMVTDKTFSTATIYLNHIDSHTINLLSTFTSIVFSHSSVLHKTLLIHASVVEKDGEGYAFLGKSGTGKSTHSALWLQYIEGTALLNDDNPAIRIEEDGSVNVYGTPWSGKTPCYNNRKARLRALIRLEKAPENSFVWEKSVDALITLLPSCSSMRWDEKLFTAMCSLNTEVISKVAVGHLRCLPDKEAVLLCYAESKKIRKFAVD